MRLLAVVAAAVLLCSEAQAQLQLRTANRMLEQRAAQRTAPKVWYDLGNLKDGDYHLKIVGGVVTIVPVTIVTLGEPSPPPVPSLQTISRDAAIAIGDATTARKLADAYSEVLRQEFQTVPEMSQAIRNATDSVMLLNRWDSYRQKISAELTRMAQDGLLATVPQYAEALTQIRDGLRDASRQGAF